MSGPGRAPEGTVGSEDAEPAPHAVAGSSASATSPPISFPAIQAACNQIQLSSAPMSAELLWQPSAERIERATLTRFARERGLPEDYGELWRWSVENLDEFWAAIWDFFDVEGSYERVLGSREMPG